MPVGTWTAEMTVVPRANAVATPSLPGLLLIGATSGLLELHCTIRRDRLIVDPSSRVPRTENARVNPIGSWSSLGLRASATSEPATLISASPPDGVDEMPVVGSVTLMSAEPFVSAVTSPWVPASLLALATRGALDVHVT